MPVYEKCKVFTCNHACNLPVIIDSVGWFRPKEYVEKRQGQPNEFLFLPKMGLFGSQAGNEKKTIMNYELLFKPEVPALGLLYPHLSDPLLTQF